MSKSTRKKSSTHTHASTRPQAKYLRDTIREALLRNPTIAKSFATLLTMTQTPWRAHNRAVRGMNLDELFEMMRKEGDATVARVAASAGNGGLPPVLAGMVLDPPTSYEADGGDPLITHARAKLTYTDHFYPFLRTARFWPIAAYKHKMQRALGNPNPLGGIRLRVRALDPTEGRRAVHFAMACVLRKAYAPPFCDPGTFGLDPGVSIALLACACHQPATQVR